jgi:multicomponent Na+:H+ antiporter subunit A
MLLIAALFAPAISALLLGTFLRKRPEWVILVPGALFLYFLTQLGAEVPLSVSLPWVPSLGVNMSFQLDGLALLFCLIISGIGTLVLLYSAGYFEKKSDYARFAASTLDRRVCHRGTLAVRA